MTPGPLSTTEKVRQAMLRDMSTWDEDYLQIVSQVRQSLLTMATARPAAYTCVLMQGSGTFAVEATLGTVVPNEGKLLILVNGAYGERMVQIAETLKLPHTVLRWSETEAIEVAQARQALTEDASISHVAYVHCETTTGLENPLAELAPAVHEAGRVQIVDAMSSFGGIPLDVANLDIDYLISSANKCIQGVPGFSFVIARRSEMESLAGRARSVSLDLGAQWAMMESSPGKWRFTSPTHTVLAFHQALLELVQEGGVNARNARYVANQRGISLGMERLGFRPLLPAKLQSCIITTFLYPPHEGTGVAGGRAGSSAPMPFEFTAFYRHLKARGFVIYPGKLTTSETLRIGSIGDIQAQDVTRFLQAVEDYMRIT